MSDQGSSSLEVRVYAALLKAGYDRDQIVGQHPIAGGRAVRGGQIIDFVLYTPMPIPIEVNGEYWHRDSGQEFVKNAEIAAIYGREPVVIWGDECKTDEDALATVIRKIGRRW